ncbi:MAG TPA: hypothetical protein DCL73_02460 [Treponema sp.]|nr:hypothetical protein [Treponema sp.]
MQVHSCYRRTGKRFARLNGCFLIKRPDALHSGFFYVRANGAVSEHNLWITVDKLWIKIEKKEMKIFFPVKFFHIPKNFNLTATAFVNTCIINN